MLYTLPPVTCAIVIPARNWAMWIENDGNVYATSYKDLGDRIYWNSGKVPEKIKQLTVNRKGNYVRIWGCK